MRVVTGACGAVLLTVVLSSCRITPAISALPDGLPAGAEAWAVNGHQARYRGAQIGFGPYHTPLVEGSGGANRWALTGRHLGIGRESRGFGFQLERQETPVLGVACASSLWFLRLKTGEVHADIGEPGEVPALVCDLWPASASMESPPQGALTLRHRGWDIVGQLDAPCGPIDIASTRRLEGVGVQMGVPVAYRLSRGGRLLAHVDLLNDGTVRMDPSLTQQDRDWLAAVATALLMKVE